MKKFIKMPSFNFSKITAPFHKIADSISNFIRLLRKTPMAFGFFILFLSWASFAVVHFAHPYPKTIFYPVMILQFAFGFIPNFFFRRTGRIFTAAGALVLTRIGSIAGAGGFVTLAGLFTGAISAIVIRDLLAQFIVVETAKETDPLRRISGFNRPTVTKGNWIENLHLGILVFLVALILERLMVYYNAPYVKGFKILESMYLWNVASREAFGLSFDIVSGIFFPLLYVMTEEKTSPETIKPHNHWIMGLVAGFTVNLLVMYLQSRYSLELFAKDSNLSVSSGRLTGLFRDSGSSSWIMASLFVFFIILVLNKTGVWRNFTRRTTIVFLLAACVLLGLKQGRTFYFIFFPSLAAVFTVYLYKSILNKYLKYLVAVFPLLLLLSAGIWAYYKGASHQSEIVRKISLNIHQAVSNPDRKIFMRIDPERYLLNAAAIDFFSDSPWFGNGVGSFIIELKEKDPYKNKYPLSIIDGPGSFYTGILQDVGIFGFVTVLLWLIMQVYYRKNIAYSLLLLLPFLTGYQITHPDGAFLAVMLLVIKPVQVREMKWMKLANIFILGMSVFFFVHSLYEVNLEARGPAFRKNYTGKYQLFAEETFRPGNGFTYHVFRNQAVWAVAGRTVTAPVFLDQSTQENILYLRWVALDNEMQEVGKYRSVVKKLSFTPVSLTLPASAKYLMVEESDDKGEPVMAKGTPFCIPTSRFTAVNAIF